MNKVGRTMVRAFPCPGKVATNLAAATAALGIYTVFGAFHDSFADFLGGGLFCHRTQHLILLFGLYQNLHQNHLLSMGHRPCAALGTETGLARLNKAPQLSHGNLL